MRNTQIIGLVTLGVAAILFNGCSEVPQAEIDLAKKAVEDAKVSGAELYATDSYQAVQDSLNVAIEGVEAKKSGFFTSYDDSKEQLAQVVAQAEQVKLQAETRKAELKNEIQTTLADVKSLIETNKQLIMEAPKGKEGTTALAAIQDELTTIEIATDETGVLLEQGDIVASHNKAKAAKEKATAINTELQDVIAKYQASAKGRRG